MVILPQFEEARSFMNGRAEVKREGKWIRVDKTGTVIQ
ncbi:MAG: WG repeat-containing protein [bacterium]